MNKLLCRLWRLTTTCHSLAHRLSFYSLSACTTIDDLPRGADGGSIVTMNDPGKTSDNRDGSRIKIRYTATELEDGARSVSPFGYYFDTKLGAPCNLQTLEDGKTRCFPSGLVAGTASDLFSDPACMNTVAIISLCAGGPKPAYVQTPETSPGACGLTTRFIYHDIDRPIDRKAIYSNGSGKCAPATDAQLKGYPADLIAFMTVGAKTDPAQFVAIKQQWSVSVPRSELQDVAALEVAANQERPRFFLGGIVQQVGHYLA